ncbi:hypothetical protein Tco_0290811 [Tanacetum coccineum]
MVSFQRLHSHLKCLSNNDLKETPIESGFKRAFATLFGQDLETFTGTMFLYMDQLQKQLDNEESQEIGFMSAFKVLETQFQMFIKSRIYLEDEYVDIDTNKFLQYTRLEFHELLQTEEKTDTSNALDALDASSVIIECRGIVSDEEIEKKELEAHYGFMARFEKIGRVQNNLDETSRALGEATSSRDSCLIALQTKQTELEKYTALNDLTSDYKILQTKLNDTLGLLAIKDIDIQEGLKTKTYEISVVNQKHEELVKKSLLNRSQFEGQLKRKLRFCPNGEETVTLEKESRSKLDKDKVKPYDYTYQNSLYETFKPPSKTYLDQLERAKEIRKTMWRKTFVRTKPNIAKNEHRFLKQKTTTGPLRKTITPNLVLLETDGRIFKTQLVLDGFPTGIFAFSTNKVNSEPAHGSIVDIPHIHACKQTLGLSAAVQASVVNVKWCLLKITLQAPFLNVQKTFDRSRSSLVFMSMMSVSHQFSPSFLHQMTSDHNRSELGIQDHINEQSSSKLVPKVVP